MALLVSCLFLSCKDDEDNRTYEPAKIVGVSITNVLYTPAITGDNAVIVLKAGTDLSLLRTHILVANGEIVGFNNNVLMDLRLPIPLQIQGFDGTRSSLTLKVQSPPLLGGLYVEGMSIAKENISAKDQSIVVKVPKGTNLTALKVSLEFVNGELVDFTNNTPKDYTNPVKVNVRGVDQTTIYSYDLTFTSE